MAFVGINPEYNKPIQILIRDFTVRRCAGNYKEKKQNKTSLEGKTTTSYVQQTFFINLFAAFE